MLNRDQTDRLLASDKELGAIDPERFNLDLSEIADEARAIVQAIESTEVATATDLMMNLGGKVAHLSSHWRSLARLTEWVDVYRELDRTAGSVNGDPWWRRLMPGI